MIHIFSRYHSPGELLDHALIELGVSLEANQVFRSMPDLRDLATRFVWWIGDEVRLPIITGTRGERIIHGSLVKALHWAFSYPFDGPVTVRNAQTLFAAGLLYSVQELPYLDILVDGKPWSYLDGRDLGDEQAAGAQITTMRRTGDPLGEPNPSTVRLLVLTRLYPDGGHLLLDIDLQSVLWPPWSIAPSDFDDDEDED